MKRALLFLLLLSTAVAADDIASGEITLLALTERGGERAGSVASLSLEIQDGDERVFLETFPMTKVATQASLRFAQQIACKELELDCDGVDFLFRIDALPGIVGGPSAGSAAAVLVSALLLDKPVPSDVAVTGTINSGGTIGPVGGLDHKIRAAGNNSVRTVLIPKGTRETTMNNETVDLVEFGKEFNVSVHEVATLGEALEIVLGVPAEAWEEELRIDPRYEGTMSEVAGDLCARAEGLKRLINGNVSGNFTRRAATAREEGAFYAAASFCFRSNVEYRQEWYEESNFSEREVRRKMRVVEESARELKENISGRDVGTLTDLQTFMAVMERVDEALSLLEEAEEFMGENLTSAAQTAGFAEERLFSAVTWARFFDGHDREIVVNEKALKEGCGAKISEVEERYNYVKSILPDALSNTRRQIDRAYVDLQEGEYMMCIYKASKAKAETDVLLNLMGVKEDRFAEVINLKLDVARSALIKAQRKDIFPIIAYSYYEYAQSLTEIDRVSALLFAEYALELANLDIYFEKEGAPAKPVLETRLPENVGMLLLGLGVGVILRYALGGRRKRSKRRSR